MWVTLRMGSADIGTVTSSDMSELRAFIFQLRIQDAYFLQRCADQLWLGLLRARPFFYLPI